MASEKPTSDNLVLEHLKRIQSDIAEMKRDIRELKATNIVDLKSTNTTLMSTVGEMMKATSRAEERFAHFELRIERMENKLNVEASPQL